MDKKLIAFGILSLLLASGVAVASPDFVRWGFWRQADPHILVADQVNLSSFQGKYSASGYTFSPGRGVTQVTLRGTHRVVKSFHYGPFVIDRLVKERISIGATARGGAFCSPFGVDLVTCQADGRMSRKIGRSYQYLDVVIGWTLEDGEMAHVYVSDGATTTYLEYGDVPLKLYRFS